MASKKGNEPSFVMTKVITKVMVLDSEGAGGLAGSPYQTSDLDTVNPLEVFGTMYHYWEDGSGCPCYLVMNNQHVITPRAMRMFSVLDWE